MTEFSDHSDPFDTAYLGLDQNAATTKADALGLQWRIVRIDDRWAKVTKDHRPERLNFEIDDGLVARVTKG